MRQYLVEEIGTNVGRAVRSDHSRAGIRSISIIVFVVAVIAGAFRWREGEAALLASDCQPRGWFPASLGLKDHSVFWYQGFYYLVSIYLSSEHYEDRFAYARSVDFCNWEVLPPVLAQRTPGAWDEFRIWAPFVYEEGNIYYMYYTGVTNDLTQSIMLATSTNPDDSASWEPQGVVFQPRHPGMTWEAGQSADCRDPMVKKEGETYYLYYTARDDVIGIVGVATATSPRGPWLDWGAVLTLAAPLAMAESPTVTIHQGLHYLFYDDTSQGEHYRIGASPTGPWTEAYRFTPGWAHEIWKGSNGDDYTSFLTTYTVTISRLSWDTFYEPARPFIGAMIYRSWLPLVTQLDIR